jgi:hypothetical protein
VDLDVSRKDVLRSRRSFLDRDVESFDSVALALAGRRTHRDNIFMPQTALAEKLDAF